MKVLLPIDGSIYSERAVEYVCNRSSLKNRTNTLYLLNVQKKVHPKAARKVDIGVIEEILDEEARATLKPAKKALEKAGYNVKTRVEYGKATNRILEVAKEINADLIVMGSHGHTPVNNVLFGSKTSAVIASCKIPMLVIRHKFKGDDGKQKIGVCVDGSPYSQSALEYVVSHLEVVSKNAEFSLINVITPYSGILMPEVSAFGAPAMTAEEFEKEQRVPAEKIAKPFADLLKEKGFSVREIFLKGDPSVEISRYAEENNLNLLVMGTHGASPLRMMMVGSTTMRVAYLTDLPLLLIHRETPVKSFRK